MILFLFLAFTSPIYLLVSAATEPRPIGQDVLLGLDGALLDEAVDVLLRHRLELGERLGGVRDELVDRLGDRVDLRHPEGGAGGLPGRGRAGGVRPRDEAPGGETDEAVAADGDATTCRASRGVAD